MVKSGFSSQSLGGELEGVEVELRGDAEEFEESCLELGALPEPVEYGY